MIAAYLLARDHRSIMVIEDGSIGGLQGGFEAAHSASVIEAPPEPRIVHRMGLRNPRGSATRALYWKSGDPVRWVHVRSHGNGAGEVLMVGGEDPAAEEDHMAYRCLELERWARSRFPGVREVVQRFTGQAVAARDVFAFATRGQCDSESVYVATGQWGKPMTRGTLAGLVIKDFADGTDLRWPEIYAMNARQSADASSARPRDAKMAS